MSISSRITLISELAASTQGWIIHARVVSKSPAKQWSNAKGKGSFFHVTLKDESRTTIRATFFKHAVDQFYGKLIVGNLYSFSTGLVKIANSKFNTCQSHHELIMDTNSDITLLQETKIEKVLPKQVASAVTPPPKPSSALPPPSSSGGFHHSANINSGVIKRGEWSKPPNHVPRKTTVKSPVTPPPPPEEVVFKPLRDANLSDAERAQLRADRAAAAEARIQKQHQGGINKKRKRNIAQLLSPHSSKRMRWSL
jgi:hypothetical protein